MRWSLALAVAVTAFAAYAETLPPLYDKPPPDVKFKAAEGWRLSAVVHYETTGAVTTLAVEGDVINDGKEERTTPKVRLTLLDAAGGRIFHWTVVPAEPRLKPREWSAFDGRLEGPPAGIVTLEIATDEAH